MENNKTIRVVNNSARPLAISRLEQQGEHFHADIKPVESGKVYELDVTVPDPLPSFATVSEPVMMLSTQITSWPTSAKQAPVTKPT